MPPRRNAGLASLDRHQSSLSNYSALSVAVTAQQLTALQDQLQIFQSSLHSFASKHRSRIVSDPIFRSQFSDMCAELGVDPLGGGKKGVWDYIGVGEWTYELAVQVVDVCLATKERNGGLIEMDELLRGVTRLRTVNSSGGPDTSSSKSSPTTPAASDFPVPIGAVTASDISQAIKALEPLGCGYSILKIADRQMVRSVPLEFDTDSLVVLESAAASKHGFVTEGMIWEWTRKQASAGSPQGLGGKAWPHDRIKDALNKALMGDGLVWIDDQAEGGQTQYWAPSLFEFTT